jgi:hypothetical protein
MTDVQAIRAARAEAEKDIAAAIAALYDCTGLCPMRVDFDVTRITQMGGQVKHVIGKVRITLESL